MFMMIEPTSTALPDAADPNGDRQAGGTAPSRSAHLLGLVRELLTFGQALLHVLQHQDATTPLGWIFRAFGSSDIALIIARVKRGLMLAAALDARLVRREKYLDMPAVDRLAAVPSDTKSDPHTKKDRPARTKPPTLDADDAALLARLPTAQEIAARIHRMPIGTVLAEICHDLGITPTNVLWQELQLAIIGNNGDMRPVVNATLRRLNAQRVPAHVLMDTDDALPDPEASSLEPIGTGPP